MWDPPSPWPERQRPTPPSHQPAPHLLTHQSLVSSVSKTKTPRPFRSKRVQETESKRILERLLFLLACPFFFVAPFFLILLFCSNFYPIVSPHSLVHTSPCLPSLQVHARVFCSDSLTSYNSFPPPHSIRYLHILRLPCFRTLSV
jgi:hypothetical protein